MNHLPQLSLLSVNDERFWSVSPNRWLELRSLDANATGWHLKGSSHLICLDCYIVIILVLCPSRAARRLSGPCVTSLFSCSTNCSIWDKTSHWIIDQVCDEFQELTAACATWLERNGYNGGFQGHNDFQGPGWKEERDAWPYLADENKERTFATFYRLITRLSFIKNLLWRIWGAQPESTDLYSVQSTCFGFKTVLISFVSQDKKVVFFCFHWKLIY